ncbi:MAG TPA: rifamycin-inactivating phosphotransferase [Actinospica sp.]|nr:rifamycin-inactivating phosphotransferase [Actinospica sp.]
MSGRYVVDLREVDETRVALVGGKGAQLGGLTRIEGISVPEGFCVTTEAFRRVRDEGEGYGASIAETPMPQDVAAEIAGAIARFGEDAAYAVRSSATAEDLPTASFAGQQDTYLNIVGSAEVLRHVSRCWASLFTERAMAYRERIGIDHGAVDMAVVVQRMVDAEAAGVLFTADPLTGNRRVATVDAVFGLGEALVSGQVTPDAFAVRDGEIVGRSIAGERPALTDAEAVRLVELGRRIEAHFGRPQDIEWCLADGGFRFVQSRPITTLFPIPEAADQGNHVYCSVGHQQMMTDAMKPLGLSMWKLTAMAPMHEAGGRLFVDATPQLASPASRAGLLDLIGRGDPLTRDALETVLAREDFIPLDPDAPAKGRGGARPDPIETDPGIVAGLIERSQESIAELGREIRSKSGPELFDFLLAEAFVEHKQFLVDPLSFQALMAGMDATWWLNEKLLDWLGEKNAADTLTLSAPDNITSEMGLALLDVADAIRPYPEVVAFLEGAEEDGFLDELPKLPGGTEAREAIEAYLDRYGMRCVGEIDITRPRWRERPSTLVPVILDNLRNFAPGAAARRFEEGRLRAEQKEADVLTRLRALPDGGHRADETKRMIDRVRTFIGYREYPKYGIISRYLVYKQALMAEAERLADGGVIGDKEDVFYLTFEEFQEVVSSGRADERLIRRRRDDFRTYQALTPPRVLTSEGEALNGAYRRDDVPDGALIGLAVSAGTVEGRARVILDMARADLGPGDILVTTATDPSWSPLFVAVAGLVTEIGGLMTHGAVIAREYGLPAVVGVDQATRRIRDGQRIRVHGTDGYVEILD